MEVQPLESVPRSLDEIASAHSAVSDRTPSVVLKAFLPEAMRLGELVLQPLTIKTWMILEKIESPFLRTKPDSVIGIGDILPTLFVLTQSIAEVERVLDLPPGWCVPLGLPQPALPISAQGKQNLGEAVTAFAEALPMRHLLTIGDKIASHIAAEFAPNGSLAPARDATEGGGSPLAPSAPAMAAGAP